MNNSKALQTSLEAGAQRADAEGIEKAIAAAKDKHNGVLKELGLNP